MARIALTGGSGFVGRQTLEALLDAGHHVNALVRHPTKLPTRTGLSTIVGTLDQADALERLVGDADAVVHIAGATAGRKLPGSGADQRRRHRSADRCHYPSPTLRPTDPPFQPGCPPSGAVRLCGQQAGW